MTDDEPTREFECESCGKKETLTDAAAFDAGWDYPPFVGVAGIISPRTCGDCGVQSTAWWALVVDKKPVEELTEHQRSWLERISKELPAEQEPEA